MDEQHTPKGRRVALAKTSIQALWCQVLVDRPDQEADLHNLLTPAFDQQEGMQGPAYHR